jgi:hypothetical protein
MVACRQTVVAGGGGLLLEAGGDQKSDSHDAKHCQDAERDQ